MRYQHIGYQLKGFYRAARLGNLLGMNTHIQHRLKVLKFFAQHGLAPTIDAYGISRRTLYRWQAALRQANGDSAALTRRCSAPKHRRQANWPVTLVAQIRHLRTTHPNLGKAKVHALLGAWCREHSLAVPSVSTIGRIIASAPDQMRHAPTRLKPNGRRKPLKRIRRTRKPKDHKATPLTLFAADTVVRMHDGLHRYLFTFIDPSSRFAIAFAAASPTSRQTTIAFDALCDLLPAPPQYVLTDNGAEFKGEFDANLQQRSITHWWTYPRCPKMNAHAERFNRTIQESFVDYHEELLFTNLDEFNRKMADWLVFYNTQLPHHSLNLKSPVQFLIHHQIKCQKGWTYTICRLRRKYRVLLG